MKLCDHQIPQHCFTNLRIVLASPPPSPFPSFLILTFSKQQCTEAFSQFSICTAGSRSQTTACKLGAITPSRVSNSGLSFLTRSKLAIAADSLFLFFCLSSSLLSTPVHHKTHFSSHTHQHHSNLCPFMQSFKCTQYNLENK